MEKEFGEHQENEDKDKEVDDEETKEQRVQTYLPRAKSTRRGTDLT